MFFFFFIRCLFCFFFFFQAEDGIRDRDVTGVQTCALPISRSCHRRRGRINLSDCRQGRDRKSTRLNSSHITISYAVFCLKKKKKKHKPQKKKKKKKKQKKKKKKKKKK